jgi:cytochrome c-type biogenesis protein CcmF
VLVALLLAMVPYLTWRGNSEIELAKKLIPGAVAAVLITVGAAVVAVRDPFHLFFIFLAALALTTNLHKTVMLARTGGLKAAGGYLSHVGVGIMLLGFLSSSAYDFSSKVTLEQGVPTQVGDMTVTFNRFIDRGVLPAECGNRECMEVEVTRADGKSYLAYPRMFINQRTRQTMVHPDVKTTLLRDFYISPIEFEPGTPAGGARTVELTAGQEADLGGSTVRFLGFDMDMVAHAQAQLASGGPVTVGANVEVVRDGQAHRITPLYQFDSTGQVQTPGQPVAGGVVYLAGIDATAGAVRLYLEGLTPGAPEVPSKLSIDVTKKPLIILVWGGLWVVLIGGLLSTFLRLRQALAVDRSEPTAAG